MAAITVTVKQHDTRPRVTFTLWETNQTTGGLQVVDLTNAASAKLIGSTSPVGMPVFSSVLALATNLTSGQVTWTPISSDTAVIGTLLGEIQVTFADGGIETYPADGYFNIVVVADLGS